MGTVSWTTLPSQTDLGRNTDQDNSIGDNFVDDPALSDDSVMLSAAPSPGGLSVASVMLTGPTADLGRSSEQDNPDVDSFVHDLTLSDDSAMPSATPAPGGLPGGPPGASVMRAVPAVGPDHSTEQANSDGDSFVDDPALSDGPRPQHRPRQFNW